MIGRDGRAVDDDIAPVQMARIVPRPDFTAGGLKFAERIAFDPGIASGDRIDWIVSQGREPRERGHARSTDADKMNAGPHRSGCFQ